MVSGRGFAPPLISVSANCSGVVFGIRRSLPLWAMESSGSSPAAILATVIAQAPCPAGRFSPFGPLGIPSSHEPFKHGAAKKNAVKSSLNMQTDLHFYGTYVIARAAGFPSVCAQRIAYASQFVDDSTHAESKRHKDGGVLHAIATSHHPLGSEFSAEINPDDPRLVWIPFHFLPGGAGDTLEEQLLCIKDSDIAQEMVEHHIDAALGKEVFAMELLGIMTHVYLDTFSHYGFSGVGSEYNEVESGPFETIGEVSPKTRRDLEESYSAFAEKYVMQAEAWTLSRFLVGSTKKFAIGHGAVATYPDKPFLHWRVAFKKPRPNNGTESFRNNTETYLEGCEKLHGYFSCFVKRWRSESKIQPFSEI